MPAVLAIARLLGLIWGYLVTLMPVLARLGPWLVGLVPWLVVWLRKLTSWFGADTLETLMRGAAAVAIRTAVLVAWAICLAAVSTGIAGMGLHTVLFQNPFSGVPAGVMFLVASAFPIKFFLGLATSYVIFRATVYNVTLVMARTVKFLFGG